MAYKQLSEGDEMGDSLLFDMIVIVFGGTALCILALLGIGAWGAVEYFHAQIQKKLHSGPWKRSADGKMSEFEVGLLRSATKLINDGKTAQAVEVTMLLPESEERNEILNQAVSSFVKEGQLYAAIAVLSKLGRKIRAEEAITIFTVCVANGWLEWALEAARLRGSSLNPDELGRIRAVCVQKGWFDFAQRSANLLRRELCTEELTMIVSSGLREDRIDDAYKAAKLISLGEVRDRAANSIIDFYVKRGLFSFASEVARFIGRKLTIGEIVTCITVHICNAEGDTEKLETARALIDHLPECDEKNQVIARIVDIYVGKDRFSLALELVRKMSNGEAKINSINLIIATYAKFGWTSALEAAKLLPQGKLRDGAINSVIANCLDKGWGNGVLEASKILGCEVAKSKGSLAGG